MEYRALGNTGINVSRLCFGSLVIGPLQQNLPVAEGAAIMAYAFSRGINFVDTAELYYTYKYIKAAARIAGKYPVVATKSYAHDHATALQSIEKARAEMDIDVIDIFMLHEQESRYTLDGHKGALDTFIDAKQRGIIRAVGVSTHYIEVVNAVSDMDCVDVVHPLVNYAGVGIHGGDSAGVLDGTENSQIVGKADKMLEAVRVAHEAGKGIYAMKIFGGGSLLNDYQRCMEYVINRPFIDSLAIGMQNAREVDMNIDALDGKFPPPDILNEIVMYKKKLHIDSWCQGCGNCVKRCGQKALSINAENRAIVSAQKCILCGYCAGACPEFAIKIC